MVPSLPTFTNRGGKKGGDRVRKRTHPYDRFHDSLDVGCIHVHRWMHNTSSLSNYHIHRHMKGNLRTDDKSIEPRGSSDSHFL